MASMAVDEGLHRFTTFTEPVTQVDPRDIGTADGHVKRDPSMIRLTGKHPFNAEPPLSALEKGGFITPNQLHFVRNHGPVPDIFWGDHNIEITGLVNRPVTLTMNDIVSLPSTTIPVTLACAGNRRKEQNMHKQTIGFSWGSAAAGTACWTGVFLRDVINSYAGGLKDDCKFICFEGRDKTAKGAYGTSLAASLVMSDNRDILLAYKMNGEPLPPDHGYPIRLLVPGCIGGRSVKWLARIEASQTESTNHFHEHDNKVLPTQVRSAEQASGEGWWKRPEYVIYDLNVNSVITTPAHGEQISVHDTVGVYIAKGYAYTGGNKRIQRVEVSLDSGTSWSLASIERHSAEDLASSYGKLLGPSYYKESRNWTWARWELEIQLTDLVRAEELVVRAWDSSQNTQPEHLTWNLMGMMNNCWFKVKLSRDAFTLFFEHPTTVSSSSAGGWMEKKKLANIADRDAAEKPKIDLPTYTRVEVERHASADSCWIICHSLVYDCTRFLQDHPGGAQSILLAAGTDCTDDFDSIHSEKAHAMLKDYLIGQLADSLAGSKAKDSLMASSNSLPVQITPAPQATQTVPAAAAGMPSPDPKRWRKMTLKIKGYLIGQLGGSLAGSSAKNSLTFSSNSLSVQVTPTPQATQTAPATAGLPFLDSKLWKKMTLESKQLLSPNNRLFRFSFGPSETFGLPVGKHVYLKLFQEQLHKDMPVKSVMRAYTPSRWGPGYVDFIIKIYFPENGRSGGAFTQLLDKVRIGETVDTKGPLGEYEYLGDGYYNLLHQPKRYAQHICMIAGGTGITPMWQVLAALDNDRDMPFVSLIYCARYITDLVLVDEIEELKLRKPDRLGVHYVLSQPPPCDWKGGRGRLKATEIADRLFPFADSNARDTDKLVLMCASDEMVKQCCRPIISDLMGNEFASNNIFVF